MIKPKRLPPAMLAALLLAGCSHTLPPPPPTPQVSQAIAIAEEIQQAQPPLDLLAEAFVQCLRQGDFEQMEVLAQLPAGTLADWKAATITDVRVDTREETAYYAHYLVTMQVPYAGGSGLAQGENVRHLILGEGINRQGILAFYDGALLPLSSSDAEGLGRTMNKAEQSVWQMLSIFEPQVFSSPTQLPPDRLVEYAAYKIAERNFLEGGNFDSGSPTIGELKYMVWRQFGLANYDVTQSSYYNQRSDRLRVSYPLIDPAARVLESQELADDQMVVQVQVYHDAICAIPSGSYVFMLQPNDDGSYRFVSCYRQAGPIAAAPNTEETEDTEEPEEE